MTRDRAKRIIENIEFIKAYSEGKIIEYIGDLESEWGLCNYPEFTSSSAKYRIKPEISAQRSIANTNI